jgi:hypothetical protein
MMSPSDTLHPEVVGDSVNTSNRDGSVKASALMAVSLTPSTSPSSDAVKLKPAAASASGIDTYTNALQ